MSNDRFSVEFTISKYDDKLKTHLTKRYSVVPLDPDPQVARRAWRFKELGEDNSPTGVEYDVYDEPTCTHLQCTCMGFLSYLKCKHRDCLEVFLSGNVAGMRKKHDEMRARLREMRAASRKRRGKNPRPEETTVVISPASESEEALTTS